MRACNIVPDKQKNERKILNIFLLFETFLECHQYMFWFRDKKINLLPILYLNAWTKFLNVWVFLTIPSLLDLSPLGLHTVLPEL